MALTGITGDYKLFRKTYTCIYSQRANVVLLSALITIYHEIPTSSIGGFEAFPLSRTQTFESCALAVHMINYGATVSP